MKKALELALKINHVGAQENNNMRAIFMSDMPNNVIDQKGNILLHNERYSIWEYWCTPVPHDNPIIIHKYKNEIDAKISGLNYESSTFLDKNGTIFPYEFDFILESFTNGFAIVGKRGESDLFQYLSEKGFLLPTLFKECKQFSINNVAAAKRQDDLWTLVNSKGQSFGDFKELELSKEPGEIVGYAKGIDDYYNDIDCKGRKLPPNKIKVEHDEWYPSLEKVDKRVDTYLIKENNEFKEFKLEKKYEYGCLCIKLENGYHNVYLEYGKKSNSYLQVGYFNKKFGFATVQKLNGKWTVINSIGEEFPYISLCTYKKYKKRIYSR